MKAWEKERDQAKVAAMALNALTRDTFWGVWGLDGKRPFGNSGHYALVADILEEIGAEREGTITSDGVEYPERTEAQHDYALELWAGCESMFRRAAKYLVEVYNEPPHSRECGTRYRGCAPDCVFQAEYAAKEQRQQGERCQYHCVGCGKQCEWKSDHVALHCRIHATEHRIGCERKSKYTGPHSWLLFCPVEGCQLYEQDSRHQELRSDSNPDGHSISRYFGDE